MRRLSQTSIRAKLTFLTCFVAFATLALATLGFAGLEFKQLCSSEARQLKKHARLLGHYGKPVLTLRHQAAGERLLASLASDPSIEAACLFDGEQNHISGYHVTESMSFPFHLEGKPYRLASLNRLEILSRIDAAGRPVGYVYLRSNTKAAQAQVGQLLRGMGLTCLVVFGLSCLLAVPLKRAVSTPILQLASATDDLACDAHPSVCLTDQVSPECVQVMDAVNRLIARIKESTTAAERAKSGLGERIAESNHGLAQELKRLQKHQHDLERAKRSAEAASLAKSNFFVELSQEVQEPLDGMVKGLQELLSNPRSLGGSESEDQLRAMHRDGQRLQHLMQDVTEIATIEAGRVQMDQVDCRPHEIIAGVIDAYQTQAHAKEIALEYCWRGSDEDSLRCDAERLRQVVQVLVGNAIRFTDAGGVRVSARFDEAQEVRQLRIEVTDTGIGIAGEEINRVFEPSERQTHALHEGGETVTGLHRCQKLISAMGGQITVNSSVGEGSVFTVTIRANKESARTPHGPDGAAGSSQAAVQQAPAAPPAHAEETQPVAGTEDSPAPRILVVDDSDTNRDLTQLVLRRAGARVEGAENGLEAVQAAIRDHFDLILMDMQMPVMDGFSATREIRAQGIDVPIIALTAFAMDFDEQKCLAAGCIGHLTKPVETDDLLNAAQRVLGPGKKLSLRGQTVPTAQTAPAPNHNSPYNFDLDPQATAVTPT